MPPISLQKLLKPHGGLHPVLTHLLGGPENSINICDPLGRVLFGKSEMPAGERFPVLYDDQSLGWVEANGQSTVGGAALADLLAFLAAQEAQKKSLAAELVDRYRELNLHYHLTEWLSAAAEPEPIAHLAIEETLRLVPATFGLALLLHAGSDEFHQVSLPGQVQPQLTLCCLVEQALVSGKAGLANAVSSAEYFVSMPETTISILCAPLKTEKSALGAILLVRQGREVFSAGDLKLLNTIAMQTAPAIEISRLYQVAVEKARFERELQMARQVQESLLPIEIPRLAGWTIANRWRPAHEVSGDFYDLIDEAPGRLGLVIGDVTDKGMPASLFMVFVRGALRASVQRSGSPAEAIADANRVVCRDSHEGLFATLFYSRLQVETGEVQYVNAGHNPPLHYQAGSGAFQLLARTGLPLGVEEEAEYLFQAVKLEPGDFIFFYTDGLIEATNPSEEEFGLERLITSLLSMQGCQVEQILDGLERELAEYTASAAATDDITLMVVKRG